MLLFNLWKNVISLVFLRHLNTSYVTLQLTVISPLSCSLANLNTKYVTTMRGMFYDCTSITSLDLSSFDTSSVTNMSNMFMFCTNLTKLNLESFDTSKATNMDYMFYGSTNLSNVKVSNKWVVGSTTTVEYMFKDSGTDHVTTV